MNKLRGALGLALILGSALIVPGALPPGPAQPAFASIAQAPDTGTALAAARRQRTSVTVTGLTTEDRLIKAEPDGTLTAELATVPKRVQRGGGWVDVDTTLVRRAGGLIAPRATTVDVVFSGGGSSDPLVSVGVKAGSVSLNWPGELPVPTLSGAVATYPNVLPGVDLRLRAEPTGYTKHFVVRDAEAAKNLAKIRLGLATNGVTMKAIDTGATEVRDSAGDLVLVGSPSVMWDDATEPGVDAPSDGARRAKVGIAVDKDSVTLVPDQALLRDPKTRWPVVIDPGEHTPGRHDWAKVMEGNPNDEYWHGGGDDGIAKVGKCPASLPGGWTCNGIGVVRTYYNFNTLFLDGRTVLDARFNTVSTHGPQCDQHRTHQLWATGGNISPETNWNNKPLGYHVDSKVIPGCGQHAIGFEVRGNVDGSRFSTYYLQAEGEGDEYAWRKYDPNQTSLWVKYNARPDFPSAVANDPPLPTPCKWCGGKSWVKDEWIRAKTYLNDRDGDQLRAWWNIYDSAGQNEEHRNDAWLGSGTWFSRDIDLRSRHGRDVSWWVAVTDGTADNGWREGPGVFAVDLRAPTVKPEISSALYPSDNRWHGGAWVPGDFTFTAPGVNDNGVNDVDHYMYGWSYPPTKKIDAESLGGKATVTLPPEGDGPRDLYVDSVDRAGNHSPTTVHHIYVRAGNGPLAQWSFEGNASDTAFLGWRDATLTGGTSYTPAAVGAGLALDGVSGNATAPNTVRTDASFSVSAWARLDRVDNQYYSVISQGGNRICGFCLHYEGATQRWVFVMPHADSDSPGGYSFVRSASAPIPGAWTHLAGTYDAYAKKIRLYVNGVPVGTPQSASHIPWHAAGLLHIGNAKKGDRLESYFPGAIDEVKAYDRLLSDVEIRAEVSRDNVQLGHWRFDETKDKTAANSVIGGVSAILNGGAKFVPGQVNWAVKLENPSDFVSTGTPVLRTDQSFSIGAWLKLDQAPVSPHTSTAISQSGAVNSGFYLGYRNLGEAAGGRWEFHLPSADATTRPNDSVVRSGAGTAKVDTWAHVMAVYDAASQQIRLYVNGKPAGTETRTAGFNATGALLAGRGLWEGNVTNPWKGSVDELRAYSRALSTEEIEGIVSGDGVTAGNWKFDGNLLDSSPRALHGNGINGVDYAGGQSAIPDPSDLAVRLNGTTNYVSTQHAIDTSASFSVAAWARLDKAGGYATVVSQDGGRTSTFQLHATPQGKWAFVMFSAADTDGGGTHYRLDGPTAQVGVWTHLVGVYDAGSRRLLLYVNGVLAGSGESSGFDNPNGWLQIGAARWDGGRRDYFTGAIDDVSVHTRPLFAAEIQVMAGRDLTLVHNWTLDEPSGRNTSDAVGARGGTLVGDAAFTLGRVGNAIRLDGTGDAVTTTGLDLRTDQSFTVTAWVRLGAKDCDLTTHDECRIVAVGADGDSGSKFRLGHVIDNDQNPDGAWTFELPELNGTVTKAAVATLDNEVGNWVHLTGMYDVATKRVWLYVNAIRLGEGTLLSPWNATGGLTIGRGKTGNALTDYWHGDVDDVRLYTGALNKDRVEALLRSYPADEGVVTLPAADRGHWKFDEGSGTTVADSSGRGLTATMKGGTGWTGGRQGWGAWLDGSTGYAETAGPVLETTTSFSAAAWVYLTNQDTVNRTVLGQDGNRVSAFLVQYNAASKKWAVILPGNDQNDPTGSTLLFSTEPAAVGDWTHLAVTYDTTTASKQLRLYVNGMLSSAQVGVNVLPSSGPLSIGRAKWNGANVDHFPRGIDDVRVYRKALSAGEVRRVHDDVSAVDFGLYRFDDNTTRDFSWRKNDAAVSGGVTFGAGISGNAAQLDGTGSAAAKVYGVSMRDSFTVSGWANLSRNDRVATIVSQDGSRNSGFVLQYRPGLNRWVFGQATGDSDSTPMVYAHSLAPPVLNRWTHIAGVYDHAARQLRIYVDGQLVGTRDKVTLWRATGQLILGRAKENGQPAGFFTGAIDEVHIEMGIAGDSAIGQRAGWAKPQSGQLGRFVNASGDRYSAKTGEAIRDGYRFQSVLGLPAASGPNTRMLYSCFSGNDSFTSTDPLCEGKPKLGEVGPVYSQQPTNLATIPLYRCTSGLDRFESRQSNCEGAPGQPVLLGYTVGYAALVRYRLPNFDHLSTVDGTPPSYLAEGSQGYLGLVHEGTATESLYSCVDGGDYFVSTDSGCEGKQVLGSIGVIWKLAPDGKPSKPLYRCIHNGQRFTSLVADCGGQTFDKQLGHVLNAPPTTTAEFSA